MPTFRQLSEPVQITNIELIYTVRVLIMGLKGEIKLFIREYTETWRRRRERVWEFRVCY